MEEQLTKRRFVRWHTGRSWGNTRRRDWLWLGLWQVWWHRCSCRCLAMCWVSSSSCWFKMIPKLFNTKETCGP